MGNKSTKTQISTPNNSQEVGGYRCRCRRLEYGEVSG
jgi:hypothetical protein